MPEVERDEHGNVRLANVESTSYRVAPNSMIRLDL